MYEILAFFLLSLAIGFVVGYCIGIRRRKIMVNLWTEEMNEMADRLTDMEIYLQELDEIYGDILPEQK
jgi:hypothetical protein